MNKQVEMIINNMNEYEKKFLIQVLGVSLINDETTYGHVHNHTVGMYDSSEKLFTSMNLLHDCGVYNTSPHIILINQPIKVIPKNMNDLSDFLKNIINSIDGADKFIADAFKYRDNNGGK